MCRVRSLALCVALLALPASAQAEGMRVRPGLWVVSVSLDNPLGGDAARHLFRTCLREGEITPDRVMAESKDCRVWDARYAGPSVRWKMRCETPAGPMSGGGSLRYSDSAVAGSVEMSRAVGSVEIPVTGRFRARRVGTCK